MEKKSILPLTAALIGATALSSAACGQFPALIKADELPGKYGFWVRGTTYGQFAATLVGLGDVNGDGIDDFASGSGGQWWHIDCYCEEIPAMAHVLFGNSEIAGEGTWVVDELEADGGGVQIPEYGFHTSQGLVGSARDFNGDGLPDVLIGAPNASPSAPLAGRCHVIYGTPGLGGEGSFDVTKLDGTNGFTIYGSKPYQHIGWPMVPLGDFNGDGVDDIAFGWSWGSPPGKPYAGQVFIVYGGTDIGKTGSFYMGQLDAATGLVINGPAATTYAGYTISPAADFNGDGCMDILIGTVMDTTPGEAYLVYGGPSVGQDGVLELSALDGINGFVLRAAPDHKAGTGVGGVGDVNADGYADVAVVEQSVGSRVVFGGPDVAPDGVFALASLDGGNGFSIDGSEPLAVGDLNHDGFPDFSVRKSSNFYAIVFGAPTIGSSGAMTLASLDGRNGFVFHPPDNPINPARVGDVNADGVDDFGFGWAWDKHPWTGKYKGEVDVIFGRRLGDGNCDGRLDAFDIDPFILAAIDPDGYAATYPDCIMNATDINGDGQVDAFDIDPFVALLTLDTP
jgi:hypothetical protein